MNEVRNCIQGGGFWALAGAIAVSLPAAFTPTVTAQCNNPAAPTDDGQIGIQGNFEQLCDSVLETSDDVLNEPGDTNDGWTGLAFPFQTGGGMVDAVTFTLNTNRAGGDIWIVGNVAGPAPPADPVCGQPDITNVLAVICCALEGLATDTAPPNPVPISHTVNFPPVLTSAVDPTWVVFVSRTGLAGQAGHDIDGDGTDDVFFFDGSVFPGHQVARDCNLDMADPPACQTLSSPGQAFANLAGTGNPGDWTDLDTLGNPTLGTPYVVSLGLLGNGDDGTNCISNPAPTVVCCLDTPPLGECIAEVAWKCGGQGGIDGPENSVCFFNPFGACSCGPESGNCTDPAGNGTKGCELVICCGVVCGIDPACCSFEWDAACALFAADFTACILCQDAVNCQIANAEGNGGFLSQSSDVNADPPTAHADNFVPSVGGLITETCWWGFYADSAGDDCAGAFVGPDAFTVTYYLNDPVGGNPGIPGAVHAGPFAITAVNLEKQPTARLAGGDDGFIEFIYTATHAAVPVNAGQCYWMEVTNNTSGEADCLWFWQTAPAPPGDSYSADGPVYDPLDTDGFDMAMCVGIALTDITDPMLNLCVTPPHAACEGNLNPCGLPQVTGGCDIPECCGLVCTVDPNCCDIAWDQSCVDLAAIGCVALPCAGVDLSCATLEEAEVCGGDINGGCNMAVPGYTDVVSGDIVHGIAWADGGTRDTDWYRITTDPAADVNGDGLVRICVSVVSELPIVSFFIAFDPLDECNFDGFTFPGDNAYSQTCSPAFGNDSGEIPIGTYTIFAGTGTESGGGVFDGFPCAGAFGDNYMLSIDVLDNDGTECPGADAVSCVSPCPWDCSAAPSGTVDVPDLLTLLALWGQGVGSSCDFDGDGIAVPDLLALLANWGPCPQ